MQNNEFSINSIALVLEYLLSLYKSDPVMIVFVRVSVCNKDISGKIKSPQLT